MARTTTSAAAAAATPPAPARTSSSTSTSRRSSVFAPRAGDRGSRIPRPVPSLQRTRHIPAGPRLAAPVRHTGAPPRGGAVSRAASCRDGAVSRASGRCQPLPLLHPHTRPRPNTVQSSDSVRVLPRASEPTTELPTRRSALKVRLDPRLIDAVEQQTEEARLELAATNRKNQRCTNHTDPAWAGRDPVLRAMRPVVPQCKLVRRHPHDYPHHVNMAVDRAGFVARAGLFFRPCRSSRQIQNRSAAAPKAKKVHFAETLVSNYRCIPQRDDSARLTTFSWTPSQEELEGFRANEKTY